MENEQQIKALQSRSVRSNVLGCGSCAAVFVLPWMILSSGNWGMIGVIPVIGMFGAIVAIIGWVSAGNRAREIAYLRKVANAPSAQTVAKSPVVGSSEGSPAVTQSSQASSGRSMADRIEKARRAGH